MGICVDYDDGVGIILEILIWLVRLFIAVW